MSIVEVLPEIGAMGSSSPRFSVLMANYNNGQYIREAIQSVLCQTFQDWELIVVDDGSTDDSVAIISDYVRLDSRVRLLVNDCNRGCGYTKRRCAEEASDEILAFLDPDDALRPDALEKLHSLHIRYPEYCMIYSTHYVCHETLDPTGIAEYVGQIPVGESHATLPFSGPQIHHFASFKKRYYDKTGGINPLLKRAVDIDLYLKLEEVGKVLYFDEPLYYYRHNPNSISVGKNNLKAQYWRFVIMCETYYRRKKTPQVFTRPLTLTLLRRNRLSYFTSKAYQKAVSREWCKMFYCLVRALPAIYLDRELKIVRIAVTPLKNIFRSSVSESHGM